MFVLKLNKYALLMISVLTATHAFSIDLLPMNDHVYKNFSNTRTITIQNNVDDNVQSLLSFQKNTLEKVYESAQAFIKKSMVYGEHYSKKIMGYSLYSASSFLRGSSYMATLGSSASLSLGRILNTIGKVDDFGKMAYLKGYDCASYGVSLLNVNHPVDKNRDSPLIDTLLYAPRETVAVGLVLGGGLTHGAGICTRILGLTSTVSGNISKHYIAPSLTSLGRGLKLAADSCGDMSKDIFDAL